jgi:hypothetical protein
MIGARRSAAYTEGRISFLEMCDEAIGIPSNRGSTIFAERKRLNANPREDHSKAIHPNLAIKMPSSIQKSTPIMEYIMLRFIFSYKIIESAPEENLLGSN